MKALTIKQPWADAIVHLDKRVENRTWGTRYRGALAIHAGKALDSDAVTRFRRVADIFPDERGAFIGYATLVDVHERTLGCCPGSDYAVRADGVWHWVLRAPIALLEPVAYTGKLGLWQVPDHVAEAIVEASRGTGAFR